MPLHQEEVVEWISYAYGKNHYEADPELRDLLRHFWPGAGDREAELLAWGAYMGREVYEAAYHIDQDAGPELVMHDLQGLFWEAATEAASRGENLALHFTGQRLEVRRTDGTVLRALDLPPGVSLSLTPGVVAQFTPPGKVADQDGRNLLQPLSFTATVGSKTYTYTVSLIGETEVVP